MIYQHPISIWVPYVDPAGEHELFGRVLYQKEMLDVPFTDHSVGLIIFVCFLIVYLSLE